MANPVSRWTGFPKLSNPAPVQEQLWRNIIRPRFVDNGCFRHMTGDISQLHFIHSLMESMCPLRERRKDDHTNGNQIQNGFSVPASSHGVLNLVYFVNFYVFLYCFKFVHFVLLHAQI